MASQPEIKIERGVAPPLGGSGAPKYPFRRMEVGDSFFVAGKSPANLAGCWNRTAKSMGATFTARTVEGGVRVWRTA